MPHDDRTVCFRSILVGNNEAVLPHLLVLHDAIARDDRFVWQPIVPAADAGTMQEEQRAAAIGPCPPATTATAATFLVRTSRQNRFAAGDPISQMLENDSIPQYLWPAARPFADWILGHAGEGAAAAPLLQGKTVLELGSGAGLCGIAAALQGARLVVLSDMSVISAAMLSASVARNEANGTIPKGAVRVALLKWGDQSAMRVLLEQLGIPRFDVVIGSDIFYFHASLQSGLMTACHALIGTGGLVATEDDSSTSATGGSVPGGTFLCSSVARSDRMDEDMDAMPSSLGFLPRRVLVHPPVDDDDGSLRVYQWHLPLDAPPCCSSGVLAHV